VDPDTTNNSATDSNAVVTSANLSVSKTDGVSSATAGDGVTRTYTITVSNAGPSDAQAVSLSDTWPAGFDRGTVSSSQGTCTGSPSFTCALGTIVSGASATVTVSYTVPSSTTASPQVNSATATSTTTDPNTANNSASDSNTVVTSANLSVTKDDGVTSVTAGDGITRTYTITVHNPGPSDAQNVSVADMWPAGFTRGTLPGGCSNASGSDFTCSLGTVISGGTVVKTITYTVPSSTTTSPQVDSVNVTSTTGDPNTGDNTATDSNTVVTSANLSVTKDDGVTTVTAGDGITRTYTITVNNTGPSDAQAVSLSDTWPAGFSRGAITTSQGTCSGSPSFTCALGTLVSGASATVTVSYTVPSSTTTSPQVNSATATSTTGDPNTANNTAADSNTVVTSANLSVTKDDGVTSVTAGDGITRTYTITVSNTGPSDAQAVSIADTWPTGFSRGSLPMGCVNAGAGPDFTCALGTVASGATVTRAISYTVPSSTTASPQVNSVTVSSSTSDPSSANNTATDSNTVTTSANLSVTKADGVTTVTAGDGVVRTYTITVMNAGPSDAQAVSLSDTWPAGFSRGTVTPSQGTCSGTPSFTCALGTIVNGASATVSVSYTVPSSTTTSPQVNTATATSTTSDPNTADNTASDSNTVTTSANLSVTKSDGVTTVTAGDGVTYTYTMTVGNDGPSDAQSVSLADTWPAGFTRGTVTTSQGTCSGSPSFTCALGAIASGASATVTVTYTVPATAPAGSQTNSATVSSTTGDPSTGNNTVTDTNTVVRSSDLSITKVDNPHPVWALDSLSYTITVTNIGPSEAANVIVTDTLPAGLDASTATYCTGSGCNPVGGMAWTGSKNLGTLSVGATATLNIVAKVLYQPTSGSVSNTATVASGSTDPVSGNNSATATTPVNLRTTTTSIDCQPIPQTITGTVTCKATVTDVDTHPTKAPPSGTVTFSNAGVGDNGTFQSPNFATCTLTPYTATSSTCTVTYKSTTATVDTIKATYNGSNVHMTSSTVTPALVVFYDANGGGFVTGGGTIDVQAGSYSANLLLAGRANFGFVSKYQKGASVPDGQTEFQFQVGNLNFHSEQYDWLVVSGAKAQYKGSGTINGVTGYSFMLTATDSAIAGGGTADSFRIKIWNSGGTVFDNKMGGADDFSSPTQNIATGSIVIHK
jgi:uncharacterized repeat protein (TIGR01451 family)